MNKKELESLIEEKNIIIETFTAKALAEEIKIKKLLEDKVIEFTRFIKSEIENQAVNDFTEVIKDAYLNFVEVKLSNSYIYFYVKNQEGRLDEFAKIYKDSSYNSTLHEYENYYRLTPYNSPDIRDNKFDNLVKFKMFNALVDIFFPAQNLDFIKTFMECEREASVDLYKYFNIRQKATDDISNAKMQYAKDIANSQVRIGAEIILSTEAKDEPFFGRRGRRSNSGFYFTKIKILKITPRIVQVEFFREGTRITGQDKKGNNTTEAYCYSQGIKKMKREMFNSFMNSHSERIAKIKENA